MNRINEFKDVSDIGVIDGEELFVDSERYISTDYSVGQEPSPHFLLLDLVVYKGYYWEKVG